MNILKTLAAATIIASVAFTSAQAQVTPQCGPRDGLVKLLTKKHKEKQTAIGLAKTGHLIEIWSSARGSWTIIMTRADMISCIMQAGQEFDIRDINTNHNQKVEF